MSATTIVRNRSWSFDSTIFDTYVAEGDPGNVPTNHSGWTIRSQIRTKVGNTLVANLNVTFPVPTAGTVAIRHDRDFTRSLPVGDYLWDIVATDTAGIDHPYIEPEPVVVRDHPTDPANATYDFVPGGGGVIYHTHSISDTTGLQNLLDDRLPPDGGTIARYLRGDNTWQPLNKTAVGLSNVENVTLSTWTGSLFLSITASQVSDLATVDLPTINGPLAAALAGVGLRQAIRSVAVNTTALANDVTLLVDATAAPVTIALPSAAANVGRVYNVKKVDTTSNSVTITPNGADTIEGLANADTDIPGENLLIQAFGTNWNIL